MSSAFFVHFNGSALHHVQLGPGMTGSEVKEAVALAVGLPVGSFGIKDSHGAVAGFHAGLVGEFEVIRIINPVKERPSLAGRLFSSRVFP